MKVELTADERGGCVATLTGCGVGGHTARVLFMDPDFGPVQKEFDGDEVTFARSGFHGRCLATLVDSVTEWDIPAELEDFEPPTAEGRLDAKAKKAAEAKAAKEAAAAELKAKEKAASEALAAEKAAKAAAEKEKGEQEKALARKAEDDARAADRARADAREAIRERLAAEAKLSAEERDAEHRSAAERDAWEALSEDEKVEVLMYLDDPTGDAVVAVDDGPTLDNDQTVWRGADVDSMARAEEQSSKPGTVKAGTEVRSEVVGAEDTTPSGLGEDAKVGKKADDLVAEDEKAKPGPKSAKKSQPIGDGV